MQILKINNKDVVVKFNINSIKQLGKSGLTLKTLSDSVQDVDMSAVALFFHYGVKALNYKATEDDTDEMLDNYFEEGGTFENLVELLLDEYTKAMGLKIDKDNQEKTPQNT